LPRAYAPKCLEEMFSGVHIHDAVQCRILATLRGLSASSRLGPDHKSQEGRAKLRGLASKAGGAHLIT
jgi:hypothetical protein